MAKREEGHKFKNAPAYPRCPCCQPFATRNKDVGKQKKLGRRYARRVAKQQANNED